MDINLILAIYFSIAALTAIVTAFGCLMEYPNKEINGIWSWFVYSLVWIKQPLKALIRLLTTNWR